MEKPKQEFIIFTNKHSHIDIINTSFDIFLKKYKHRKIYNIIDLIDELIDLNNQKSKRPVIILFNNCYIDNEKINEIKNNNILSNLSLIKLSKYENTADDFLKFWANLMSQIQKRLTNINICFLFTTYSNSNDFKWLLDICQEQGLKNFRFIKEPFFIKELEKSFDDLLLRYYINRAKRLSFKKKNKKVV